MKTQAIIFWCLSFQKTSAESHEMLQRTLMFGFEVFDLSVCGLK